MIDRELLARTVSPWGVTLTAPQLEKLDAFAALLCEWNERMNLTAITDSFGVTVKHFADSLSLLPYLPERGRLIDVGTGAGFPAIPLLIARPALSVTLLDSTRKRLDFLTEVCRTLRLTAEAVHARAEDAAHDPALRERFDGATARAVAALPTLCEYCLPFVKVGGHFWAMKGPDEPADTAAHALSLLGGSLQQTVSLTLPAEDGTQERRILIVDKQKRTPIIYPRHGKDIKKQPL